jgi:hypothetical protein
MVATKLVLGLLTPAIRRERSLLALVVEMQRKIPDARGLRRCSPEFGF